MTKEEKLTKLNIVFSPTAPIKQKDFFFGRIQQLRKIVDAINEPGQHAILFGERGVGKTSLANIMESSILNVYPVKVTCSKEDRFKSLWQQAFNKIQYTTTIKGIGFNPQDKQRIVNLGKTFSVIDKVLPFDIVSFLNNFNSIKFLFIFDEFDNISDKSTRSSFADLIKSFSDNVSNSTVVIVGISDNVEDLIGNHQSLERCLKQVKMPRMSAEESSEIIINGLSALEINIKDKVKDQIIEFSSGFPHYVHLLCKYGAREIIENDKNEYNAEYLRIAIKIGIENSNEQLRSSYQKAITDTNSNSKWKFVLHACALAYVDQFDCFSVSQVLEKYNLLTGKTVKGGNISYNLNQLCFTERGEVLRKMGKGVNTRYRFVNPMMKAFVKLKINSN